MAAQSAGGERDAGLRTMLIGERPEVAVSEGSSSATGGVLALSMLPLRWVPSPLKMGVLRTSAKATEMRLIDPVSDDRGLGAVRSRDEAVIRSAEGESFEVQFCVMRASTLPRLSVLRREPTDRNRTFPSIPPDLPPRQLPS